MKNVLKLFSVFLLLAVCMVSVSGCARLFGPSDEEVIKAVSESGYFNGGATGMTLQPPVVVLEKNSRNSDGSWPVKVKVTFTFHVNAEQMSTPKVNTLIFNMHKEKDNAGQTVWKAVIR
jgi:hypothetical protein